MLCYAVRMSAFDPLPSEQLETRATHPMGRALRLLGDVPTLLIIVTLLHGTQRFGELRAAIGDISPKTIAHRLRLLEMHGFVRRRAFAEIPPRVEYDLTEQGFALADIVEAIRAFGERYLSGAANAGNPECLTSPSSEGQSTTSADLPRKPGACT